jgi:hypothetical protein
MAVKTKKQQQAKHRGQYNTAPKPRSFARFIKLRPER